MSSVRIDDRGGARAAAAHLVALGHRKIGIVSVLRETPVTRDFIIHATPRRTTRLSSRFALDRDRLAGYLDALASVNLKAGDIPVVETWADLPASAREGVAALLDAAPDLTAVLAMTDVQALAVIAEARRRGLRVPEDLSVVGFDDIAEGRQSSPPLTTVRHPIEEKGRVAAELLFEGTRGRHVVLPVELVERSSTTVPPVMKTTRA